MEHQAQGDVGLGIRLPAQGAAQTPAEALLEADGFLGGELQSVDDLTGILIGKLPLTEAGENQVLRITIGAIGPGDGAREAMLVAIPLQVDGTVRVLVDKFGARARATEGAGDATRVGDDVGIPVLPVGHQ